MLESANAPPHSRPPASERAAPARDTRTADTQISGKIRADARDERSDAHRTDHSRINAGSSRQSQVWQFTKRAHEYAGALKNLSQRIVVVDDRMLNFAALPRPGNVSQHRVVTDFALYGTDTDDQIAMRARKIDEVLAGGGDDILTLRAREIGNVRGNAGDDTIRVTAGTVEHVQGDNGDDSLMIRARLLLQADGGAGDDTVRVIARAIGGVSGGDGNDALSISARDVGAVYGGAGDDAMLAVARRVARLNGGSGDDMIAVSARNIGSVGGGADNDGISVAARNIDYVNGGNGDDQITIAARNLHSVNGGVGNDEINVVARSITTVSGDAALNIVDEYGDLQSEAPGNDDTISVTARTVGLVHGGAGNDTLSISARKAEAINGGRGDDLLMLNVGAAMIRVGEDAGHDVARVAAANHLSVSFAAATLGEIEFTREGDTITLSGPSGSSLRLEGIENIQELSITGSDDSTPPHVIHLSGNSGLDLLI